MLFHTEYYALLLIHDYCISDHFHFVFITVSKEKKMSQIKRKSVFGHLWAEKRPLLAWTSMQSVLGFSFQFTEIFDTAEWAKRMQRT